MARRTKKVILRPAARAEIPGSPGLTRWSHYLVVEVANLLEPEVGTFLMPEQVQELMKRVNVIIKPFLAND